MKEGTVYDVPNCELGHHGEDVSFDFILKKYELTDPALRLLAGTSSAPRTRIHPTPTPPVRACAGWHMASAHSA